MPRSTFLPVLALALAWPSTAALAQDRAPTAAATRFERDAARFDANRQKVIAAFAAQSPDSADEVRTLLGPQLLAQIAPALERMGLSVDDVADMTTAYWVTAWEAAHGIAGRETEPAVMQAARRQIAGTMARNPAVTRMSGPERQDVADAMLLQALLVEARMRAAVTAGPQSARQMSDAVHAEARQLLGTDLRSVELTADGFTPLAGATSGAPAP